MNEFTYELLLMNEDLVIFTYSKRYKYMQYCFTLQAIVAFIDGGGNMIMAGSSEATDLIRELATEVGVEMDEEASAVIDHLHHDTKLDDGHVST